MVPRTDNAAKVGQKDILPVKRLNDQNLAIIEQKFFRKMWRNSAGDSSYEFFREELFDFERVYIYIAYPRKDMRIQKQVFGPENVCVLRFTAGGNWELEVCSRSGILSKVVYPTDEDLQRMAKLVEFRGADFDRQPNPFGPNIRTRESRRPAPFPKASKQN